MPSLGSGICPASPVSRSYAGCASRRCFTRRRNAAHADTLPHAPSRRPPPGCPSTAGEHRREGTRGEPGSEGRRPAARPPGHMPPSLRLPKSTTGRRTTEVARRCAHFIFCVLPFSIAHILQQVTEALIFLYPRAATLRPRICSRDPSDGQRELIHPALCPQAASANSTSPSTLCSIQHTSLGPRSVFHHPRDKQSHRKSHRFHSSRCLWLAHPPPTPTPPSTRSAYPFTVYPPPPHLLPTMLRKTKQQIAHTSMIPSLGNRDLRALQDIINSEKAFIKSNVSSAQSWHANADALKAWGEGEGEDLAVSRRPRSRGAMEQLHGNRDGALSFAWTLSFVSLGTSY